MATCEVVCEVWSNYFLLAFHSHIVLEIYHHGLLKYNTHRDEVTTKKEINPPTQMFSFHRRKEAVK